MFSYIKYYWFKLLMNRFELYSLGYIMHWFVLVNIYLLVYRMYSTFGMCTLQLSYNNIAVIYYTIGLYTLHYCYKCC